jgi:hypothetical protein
MSKETWVDSIIASNDFPNVERARTLLEEYWDKSKELTSVDYEVDFLVKAIAAVGMMAISSFANWGVALTIVTGIAGTYAIGLRGKYSLSDSQIEQSEYIKNLVENLEKYSSPSVVQNIVENHLILISEKIRLIKQKEILEGAGQVMGACIPAVVGLEGYDKLIIGAITGLCGGMSLGYYRFFQHLKSGSKNEMLDEKREINRNTTLPRGVS